MNDFVRVLVKADTALRLPRDVAESMIRQGVAEYETAPETDAPAEAGETTEEVNDDG